MEASMILRNPGVAVSGTNSALIDGQAVESSSLPVFEQLFDQAKASAAPVELKAAVDQTTQSPVVPDVSVSGDFKGPQLAPVTTGLPLVEAAIVENLAGKTVETPADGEIAISSGSVDELTRLQTALLRKNGTVLEGREPEAEKTPEKIQKNRSETPEGEMKVVFAGPAALNVQGLNVDDHVGGEENQQEVTSVEGKVKVLAPQGESIAIASDFSYDVASSESLDRPAIPARPGGQAVEVEEAAARPVVVETESSSPARASQARPEAERTAGPAPVSGEATRMSSKVEPAIPARPGGQAVKLEEPVVKVSSSEREIETARKTEDAEITAFRNPSSGTEKGGLFKQSYSEDGATNRQTVSVKEDGLASVSLAGSGTFETALDGRVTEGARSTEKPELQENILSQVREKLTSLETAAGKGNITLRLNPRELGDMQISFRMEDSGLSVDVIARNPVVRETLLQNLEQLKETLSQRNISMERFDVMTDNGQTPNQSFREGRQTAQPRFREFYPTNAGYPGEEPGAVRKVYGDFRESSLVDMRF